MRLSCQLWGVSKHCENQQSSQEYMQFLKHRKWLWKCETSHSMLIWDKEGWKIQRKSNSNSHVSCLNWSQCMPAHQSISKPTSKFWCSHTTSQSNWHFPSQLQKENTWFWQQYLLLQSSFSVWMTCWMKFNITLIKHLGCSLDLFWWYKALLSDFSLIVITRTSTFNSL